jgi:hypothetical protein
LARSRENALSSAILYLAIVAIWAGVLVPRWIRRSHNVPGTADNSSGQGSETVAASGPPAGNAPVLEYGVAAEYGVAVEYGEVRADGTVLEYGAAVEYGAALDDGAALDGDAEDDGGGGTADPDDAPEVRLSLRGRPLWSEGPGWHPFGGPDRPRPPVSRESALRARRRTLTMLVMLTGTALALTAASITPWWIIVPPLGMLGIFVLLLREAARADADAAQRHAEANAAHAAQQARVASRQRAREALAACDPEPTAEIIDISARVGDQLYDQYADAAVRAVGD